MLRLGSHESYMTKKQTSETGSQHAIGEFMLGASIV